MFNVYLVSKSVYLEMCRYCQPSFPRDNPLPEVSDINEKESVPEPNKTSDGIYTCDRDQCGYEAKKKSILTRHIKLRHEGVKYVCNHCNQQCTTKGGLKLHIESKHDNIKYCCEECGKQFTQQGNLKLHIQSQHENVKYSCNQCDF